MKLIFDSLHSRILERQAFSEGLLHSIEGIDNFYSARNHAFSRLKRPNDFLKRCLTDISLFPDTSIVGREVNWRHPYVGNFEVESLRADPEELVQAINLVKGVLGRNRMYFVSAAPLDPRFWDFSDGTMEDVAAVQFDIDRRTYVLMLDVIEENALHDLDALMDTLATGALQAFWNRIEPQCVDWGYTTAYIADQQSYFQSVWATFGDMLRVELGGANIKNVFRTQISGEEISSEVRARDDVLFAIRKDFSKSIALVPEPRTIEEAKELGARTEVKRLSEMIESWVEVLDDDNNNLIKKIETDIIKAGKELTAIGRVRKASESDIGIIVKATLSQIPFVSNVTGAADTLFAFYQKRANRRSAWLSTDTIGK